MLLNNQDMKRSIQTTLVMCLCFVFGAQAQITKIDTYSNTIKNSSANDRESLDNLFFGPVSRIQLNDSEKPTFLSKDEGSVKAIELNSNLISQLKNTSFSNSFKSAEVIAIQWKKGDGLILDADHLIQLKSLKYILIKSYDDQSIDEIKTLFKDLMSSESVSDQIKIVYYKMELPS